MILPGEHGDVTYLRVARGWRAKMKYRPPFGDDRKVLTAEGTTKARAKRRLLEEKWPKLKKSWELGPEEGQSMTVSELLHRWYPTVSDRRRHGQKGSAEGVVESKTV